MDITKIYIIIITLFIGILIFKYVPDFKRWLEKKYLKRFEKWLKENNLKS